MHRISRVGAVLFGLASVASTGASAEIDVAEDGERRLRIGAYLQLHAYQTDLVADDQSGAETVQDLSIRRARVRVGGDLNEKVSFFMQTELGRSDSGAGGDFRLFEAWVRAKHSDWVQGTFGLQRPPASRQDVTSASAVMAVDRPGLAYRTLSRGAEGRTAFTNETIAVTEPDFSVEIGNRDIGATYYGTGEIADNVHLKLYAGVFDGVESSPEDGERYSARAQVNFFDPEPGYVMRSTYLGEKKTVAFGVSHDRQADVSVGETSGLPVDYALTSLDAYVEWPVAGLVVTGEAGFFDLDLEDVPELLQVQGSGFFVQSGVLFDGRIQPWLVWETWSSDRPDDLGSYDQARLGATYYFDGHASKVAAGFERLELDVPLGDGTDTIDSAVVAYFLKF